jgi:hypothetical protein
VHRCPKPKTVENLIHLMLIESIPFLSMGLVHDGNETVYGRGGEVLKAHGRSHKMLCPLDGTLIITGATLKKEPSAVRTANATFTLEKYVVVAKFSARHTA